ncbi:hypothetical protein BKP43_03150 [Variovorax boronicumulans]|nr:hypothetical protein BKP43_03150 [Variovorax boronicumulans]
MRIAGRGSANQRRVPVSALPLLARTLGVSVEELIGEPQTAARRRRPAPNLMQHVERISALPKTQQRTVMIGGETLSDKEAWRHEFRDQLHDHCEGAADSALCRTESDDKSTGV